MAISLSLANGRRYFWQWDTKQYLVAKELPVGAELHFDMPETTIPLKTIVEDKDSLCVARVPDELLQHSGSFIVWAYVTDNINGNRTVYSRSFKVSEREKPPDYVYTETEIANYDKLNGRLTAVENALDNLAANPPASSLPSISEDDNGKVLIVDKGKWVANELPKYDGSYFVTPSVNDQTLMTAQTYLDADVKIEKIPYNEVSNNSGGMTATIGGE